MSSLTVMVGDQRLWLPSSAVRVVVRLPKLTFLPGAAPATLGLMNLRGSAVPVISVRLLLGLARGGSDEPVVVVVQSEHRRYGLLVDRAVEMDLDHQGPMDLDRVLDAALGAPKAYV